MQQQPVSLRPLTVEHLPLVGRWLSDPRVSEWWSDDPAAELADIAAEVRTGGSTVYRIVELEGNPVGFLFRYRVDEQMEYLDAVRLDLPEDAWSMDYLIGENAAVGRGVGTTMIRVACDELWESEPTASCVLVPVHADNERSWKALQRAGFVRFPGIFEMEPDTAAHDGRHVIYSIRRPQAA